jgi:phosphoglycolate phosphatase
VRHVVFDWNGTLIDDCALAVATVNTLLAERSMAPITREQYRRAFRFPISAFYRDLGFDVDDRGFSALMRRYLDLFNAQVDDCPLHAGARETIARLRAAAIRVHILSASNQDTLRRGLAAKGLTGAFEEVAGISDHLSAGKHEIGAALARALGADPRSVLYIGDTDHDYDVAQALGWRFLFVDHGHQAAAPAAPHCAHTITALEHSLWHLGT